MKKILKNKYFILLCRIILGSIFIYASIDKILHPEAFADIIYNYKLLPGYFIYFPALFLPWLELVSGAFLIAGIFVRGSSFILNLLLTIFITAILVNIIRGVSFDCGCFSTSPSGGGNDPFFLLIRDALLLLPGLNIFLNFKKTRGEYGNGN